MAKQQDAIGDTAKAHISYEASLDDMKALLESEPAPQIKDSAFRTLGAGMIRLGRQEEAASYYQELIAASDDPQERATFSMLLTELYYDQQDFIQAENFARQLLDMQFEDDNQAGYYRKETRLFHHRQCAATAAEVRGSRPHLCPRSQALSEFGRERQLGLLQGLCRNQLR